MDTPEIKPLEPAGSTDLQEQCESLKHLMVSVLILVLVISGTLNIFFLRQLRDARRELAMIRPQMQQMITTYQKTEAPMMQAIANKFADYGRTHVDYAPILSKYGIKAAGPTNTSGPAPAEKK